MFDKETFYNGTQVNYYVICPRKLWFFSHFLQMEQNSDLVSMGKHIHETSYAKTKKEVVIDQKIAIDFIKRGENLVLHEIKKSRKMEDANRLQLLYYLYFLKNKGVENVSGEIDYPKLREVEKVELTEAAEKEVKEIIEKIPGIVSMEKPPEKKNMKRCRKCSYFEFCYVT
jgi:CRISPR-associated exonuclease Cas4